MSTTLYDIIANTPPNRIGNWEIGEGVRSVAKTEPNSQKAWKNSFKPLIQMEVGKTVGDAIKEAELGSHAEYEGWLRQEQYGSDWVFDHSGKLNRRRDISGMVAQIKIATTDTDRFEWLGVFHNLECVSLNRKMVPKGVNNIKVKIRLLVSIVSHARQYAACEEIVPIDFEKDLIGRGENDDEEYDIPAFELGPTSKALNDDQAAAVRCWVGNPHLSVLPATFMLLQGPPGTGKTMTAVSILRESLNTKAFRANRKIVCAGPSWTSVYEYIGRFMKAHKDFCAGSNLRVALTGCKDPSRIAAEEPEEVKEVSVVSLMRSIDTYINSLDRPQADYTKIMKKIKERAPDFYVTLKGRPVDLKLERKELEKALIEEATIVFATLNALGSNSVHDALKEQVDMLIVDEAGQASDGDLFIGCNLSPKRLLLIGDHRQLPPTVMSPAAMKGGMAESSLERLYGTGNKRYNRMLTVQYRMPPAVLSWPNKTFYNGVLKCAPELLMRFAGAIDKDHYKVYDTKFGRHVRTGTSYSNPSEAACVVHAILNIRRTDPSAGIFVITPYSAQRRLIQRYVNTYLGVDDTDTTIRVNTIDGSQGAERSHVILSLVRTDDPTGRGCFATEPKHLCVGLTRARESMTIICNKDKIAKKDPSGRVSDLLTDAAMRDCVYTVPLPVEVEGKMIGRKFVSLDDSVVPPELYGLGLKVIHGDEVTMNYIPVESGPPLVVSVKVTTESELRNKVIPCQIVNDRNVCFEAQTRSAREAILLAVRELAEDADGKSCNGSKVTVCTRQPLDDDFFTLTIEDQLLAEALINGKEILIPNEDDDAKTPMKKVTAQIPKEPRYHKYIPLDDQLPLIHVPIHTTNRSSNYTNHQSTVMIRLKVSEDEEDAWQGFIVGDFVRPSASTMQGLLREPGELIQLILTGYILQRDIAEGRNAITELVDYHLNSNEQWVDEWPDLKEPLTVEFGVRDLTTQSLKQLSKTMTCTGGLLHDLEKVLTHQRLLDALDSIDLPKQDYTDAAILFCVKEKLYDLPPNATFDGDVAESLQTVIDFLPSFAGRRSPPPTPPPTSTRGSTNHCPVFTIDAKGTKVFDDALSCTRNGNGWEVCLYITNPRDVINRANNPDVIIKDLCRRGMDFHMKYTHRLMPGWVIKEASLTEGSGLKNVLAVKFAVRNDGSVSDITMKGTEVEIDANLEADDNTTWDDLKDKWYNQSTHLDTLQEAVSTMMQHTRFFEEATQTRHVTNGPMHILQYLVVRAKKAAADELSKGTDRHLYTNYNTNYTKINKLLEDVTRPPAKVITAPTYPQRCDEDDTDTEEPQLTSLTSREMKKAAKDRIETLLSKLNKYKVQGNEYFKNKLFEEAIEQYNLGLELEAVPESAELRVALLSNITLCQMKLLRFEEACAAAEEGLKIDSDHEKCLIRLGNALMEMKDFKNAGVRLQQVVIMEGDLANSAKKLLAECWKRQSKYKQQMGDSSAKTKKKKTKTTSPIQCDKILNEALTTFGTQNNDHNEAVPSANNERKKAKTTSPNQCDKVLNEALTTFGTQNNDHGVSVPKTTPRPCESIADVLLRFRPAPDSVQTSEYNPFEEVEKLENEVCRRLQQVRTTVSKIKGNALSCAVRYQRRKSDDRNYLPGSSISFTSPLRCITDFITLQTLLGDRLLEEQTSSINLYTREMAVDRKKSCQKEFDRVKKIQQLAKSDVVVKAVVTEVDTISNTVRLYCPVTDALFSSTLERVGEHASPFFTEVSSKLVLANLKTYQRHKQQHITPYNPDPVPALTDDEGWQRVQDRKRNKSKDDDGTGRGRMKVHFTFEKDETVARTKEEVWKVVIPLLGDKLTQDCVYVTDNEGMPFFLRPKESRCDHWIKFKECNYDQCGYLHHHKTKEAALRHYNNNHQVFVDAAEKAAGILKCKIAAPPRGPDNTKSGRL
eukprot:TRINITY_DN20910_c0_g1_i1.p1 TRINITY_DN20910_c0_g1~~TRINITY_DN20910_c0_g1_i1.p1  ORF type:complete len:1937 (+),score=398.95 TRINITY_DN20910_c0_g1_i1:46-5811(+)